MRLSILTLVLVASAVPAAAQDTDWDYSATLYGWLPSMSASIETQFGTIDGDSGSGIDLSNLDMAFMGTFSARSGAWSFIADAIYTDMSPTQDTPFGLAFSEAVIDVKVAALSGYAAYRVYDSPEIAFDVGGGFRAFAMDVDTTLVGVGRPNESQSQSASWVDPLIAARVVVPFNEKWYATGFADIGGYVTQDSSTWQALAIIGYNFNDAWSAEFGYRYMNIEKDVDGRDITIGLGGPLVGVSWNF
jgi:hypothetical protein